MGLRIWTFISILPLLQTVNGAEVPELETELRLEKLSYSATIVRPDGKEVIRECPHQRQKPFMSLIHKDLLFDEDCFQPEKDGDHLKCLQSERFCHEEYAMPYELRKNFSISLLLKVECGIERRMKVLTWNQLSINIICRESNESQLELEYDSQLYHYNYLDGMFGAIVENLGEKASKPRITDMSGNELVITAYRRIPNNRTDFDKTAIVVGKRPDSGMDGKSTFRGKIKTFSIFQGLLINRERELQYLQLLSEGAPYPECTCGDVTDTCNSGNRQLTDNLNSTNRLLWSLSGGNMSEPGDGYWYSGDTLLVTLEHVALVERIDIYSEKSCMHVSTDGNLDGSWNTIFWITKDEYGQCTKSQEEGGGWEDLPATNLSKLSWSPSEAVILSKFQMNGEGAFKIRELEFFGRQIGNQRNGNTSCSPVRINKTKVKRRCKPMSMKSILHPECRPFISDVIHKYGPFCGGNSLMLIGGSLAPDGTGLTRVKHGTNDLCQGHIIRNNTHIICEVKQRESGIDSEVIEERLEVSIQIGGAMYSLPTSRKQTYTYHPDPIIKDISPKMAFLGETTNLTVTGENLQYIHPSTTNINLHLKNDLQKEESMKCRVHDQKQMICTLNVESEKSSKATIRIGPAECPVKDYHIMLYKKPEIIPLEEIHLQNGLLHLKGINLKSGGISDQDYSVNIGEHECDITEIEDDGLICNPRVNDVFEVPLPITVKVLGFEYNPGNLQQEKKSEKTDESKKEESHISLGTTIGVVLAIVVGLICLCIAIFAGVLWNKRVIIQRNEGSIGTLGLSQEILVHPKRPDSMIEFANQDIRQSILGFLVNRDKLEVNEIIGKGASGIVHRGFFQKDGSTIQVAIKTLKDEKRITEEDVNQFLEEATIMRNFCNPHVLSLLGVVLDSDNCHVILPYMVNRDLRSYVSRQICVDQKEFSSLVLDAAQGMKYLSELNFIHRDLAARNCMVDETGRVLIGDFGLARDMYEKDYYRPEERNSPLPIKWMAPESIDRGFFTTKSDVWSFGVTAWEVFMRGERPYSNVENYDMRGFLAHGYRLNKPPECPDNMYALILQCWRDDPHERPSFTQMPDEITSIIDDIHDFSNAVSASSSALSLTMASSAPQLPTASPSACPTTSNFSTEPLFKVESPTNLKTRFTVQARPGYEVMKAYVSTGKEDVPVSDKGKKAITRDYTGLPSLVKKLTVSFSNILVDTVSNVDEVNLPRKTYKDDEDAFGEYIPLRKSTETLL